MRNKHPGICCYCGKLIDVGKGFFEKRPGGWAVIHAECVFKRRSDKANPK